MGNQPSRNIVNSSGNLEGNDEKVDVREKLRLFVKYFVYFYEKSLTEYFDRLEKQKSKPGKWADFLNQLTETGKIATEGIEAAKAPVLIGINVLQTAITSIGNKNNRDELKKLIVQLYKFKFHPDQVRNALVEAGIEIFHSFESQFVQLNGNGSWERAMEKLAHDAVNRVLSFSKNNLNDEVLTVAFITQGVVYGESKKYKHSSTGVPHLRPGHTVQTASSNKWSTSELFENVGLVVVQDGENKYYRKNLDDSTELLEKYGFRRVFRGGNPKNPAADVLKNYSETTNQTEYQYVLQLDDLESLKTELLAEIKNEDPKLLEERIFQFQGVIEQIKEISVDNCKKLEKFLAHNPNDVNKLITNYHEEVLKSIEQGRQENKQGFEKIQQAITSMDHVIETVVAQKTNQKILYGIKETLPSFTGRKKELQKLHELLQKADGQSMPRIAAITGLGGIGKSELAKKYVSEHLEEYDSNVVWMNAERDATLRESFRRLAKDKLKLQTTDDNGKDRETMHIVEDVYSQFSSNKSLFIFDNAERTKDGKEEANIFVNQFLPQTPISKPFVIITSRDQTWDGIATLQLGVLSNDDAKELIEKALNDCVELEDTEAETLAEQLGYLPLALNQAVAFIKKQHETKIKMGTGKFTVGAYLQEFKKKAKKLLSHKQLISTGYSYTVMNTWQITIDKIKEGEGATGKLAVDILNTMAYLAPDNVQIDGFLSLLPEKTKKLKSALKLLDQYSLVELLDGHVNIHRLVQTVTRIDLEENGKNEKVIKQAFQLIKLNIEQRQPCWIRFETLPHLEVLITHFDDWIKRVPDKKDDIEQTYLVNLLKWTHCSVYNNKRGLLDRALQIYEKQFGSESLEFAQQLSKMAIGNFFGLENERAVELLGRVLKITEKKYGPDSFEFAVQLSNVSDEYHTFGEHKKAIELLDRIRIDKVCPPNILEFSKLLSKMSSTFNNLGDEKKAAELLDRAVPVYEEEFGPESLEFAQQLSKISSDYRVGNQKMMVEVMDEVLATYEKQFGPQSFQFVKKASEVRYAYFRSGDGRKAVGLLDRALAIYEKQYNPESLEFAQQLSKMSSTFHDVGDCKKAVELLNRALPIYKKEYGPESLEVAQQLFEMSRKYSYLHIVQKAVEALDEALPIYEKQYDPESLEFAKQLTKMSSALNDLGESIKAVKLLDRALPIYETTTRQQYGPESLEFAKQLSEMRYDYHGGGEHEKAVELLDRALSIYEKRCGPGSVKFAKELSEMSSSCLDGGFHGRRVELMDTMDSIYNRKYGSEIMQFMKPCLKMRYVYLRGEEPKKAVKKIDNKTGNLEFAQQPPVMSAGFLAGNDTKKAVELLDRALPIYEEGYGPESLEFAQQLSEISFGYLCSGERKKAVECLERALPIYENKYGSEHFEVACTLFDLANFCEDLNTKKQGELFDRAVLIFKNLKLFSLTTDFRLFMSFPHREWLHDTVQLGNLTWVKKLIDQGFNVLQGNFYDTVLHRALAGGKEDVVRLILDEIKGKYPERLLEALNAKALKKFTPLVLATAKGKTTIVKILLQFGADPNAKDLQGSTPLMWAAANGTTNSAKILLEFGADPNVQDEFGMTALHWAAEGGHHEVLKILLDNKADLNIEDNQARMPLDLVQSDKTIPTTTK